VVGRALALWALLATGCRVDGLPAEGRPCAHLDECGPGTVCDLSRHVCVRPTSPTVDARTDGRHAELGTPVSLPLDILFVIDNSNSMASKQQHLVDRFPLFLDGLRGPSGALPDLRIGVVSTDLGAYGYPLAPCEQGDGARLLNKPRIAGCTPPADPWISHLAGQTNVAVPGTAGEQIVAAFTCIATLGTAGCGFEQPLEVARLALDPARSINPGFLREGSILVIVIVTDEDDCSVAKPELLDPANPTLGWVGFRCTEYGIVCAESDLRSPGFKTSCAPGKEWLYSVSGYASYFKALRPPGRILVAAIAAPAGPTIEVVQEAGILTPKASCQSEPIGGFPAIRIKTFVLQMGTAGHFNEGISSTGDPITVDVCAGDYAPAMVALAKAIRALLP